MWKNAPSPGGQVHYRGVGGQDPVGVHVDEHVVVEPVRRFVQGGVVQSQLRRVGQLPVVGQHRRDPPGHAAADGVLLVPGGQLGTGRVTQKQADPAIGARFVGQGRQPAGMLLGQEQPGERQHVDIAAGRPQQVGPQVTGHIGAPRPGGGQLRPCQGRVVDRLRPQVALLLPQ